MPGVERLLPGWVALLDRHIRVTEADNLRLSTGLHIDSRLLSAARCTERLIERYASTLIVSHSYLGDRKNILDEILLKSKSSHSSSSSRLNGNIAFTSRPWIFRSP